MECITIEKATFTVVGKLAEVCGEMESGWVQALWGEANRDFHEIARLAKRNEAGALVGLWGAMSDIGGRFAPWTDGRGWYLAGCEAEEGAAAPEGWTRWEIPGFRYLAVKCTQAEYDAALAYLVDRCLPERGYSLAGAIQEYYDPGEREGALYLCAPIGRLE